MIRANLLTLIAFVGLFFISIALISQNQLLSQRTKLPSPAELRDSLKWSEYESFPTKDIIEKAPWLYRIDSRLISLALSGTHFDAERFAKKFPSYFKEYNEAENEFQRNKIVPSIKEEFETAQRDLLAVDNFVIGVTEKLGEYSFSDKGFSISNRPDFRISGVMLENEKDSELFPNIIYVNENKAERIIEANPSRNIVRFITFKPTKGNSAFLNLNVVPLDGIATSAIIVSAETGEVLAVSPFKYLTKFNLRPYQIDAYITFLNVGKENAVDIYPKKHAFFIIESEKDDDEFEIPKNWTRFWYNKPGKYYIKGGDIEQTIFLTVDPSLVEFVDH